jgi:hypothetical protein
MHSSTIGGKKVGHQISVSFEKFDVVQALLSFFYTIPADSLKIYFLLYLNHNPSATRRALKLVARALKASL